jgi:cysteine desulfurase/selenocysteine lyase
LDLPHPEVASAQTVNTNVAQTDVLKNPYAFDDYHVTDDQQLKSVLQDRNDKPATAASGYYFLQSPTIEAVRPHSDVQIPANAQNYQPIDILQIRRDFPILQERVNGKQLVWLDNAATTHKPQAVIDRISYFYQHENSNIHRAAHELAARASDAYEHARDVVARFIGAASAKNIVFVRGTTEGINLIAKSWGTQNIQAGDEIIVSHLEHHANIVPWYQLSKETGAKLRVIPVDDTGQIQIEEFVKLLNPRTKLVSITQVSNALGTVTPTQEIIALAHAAGVRVLIDGAQSVSHMPTNVTALDADFFVFSGHKVFGPTGIGAVYAKSELLDSMPVWEGGGNMIQDVTLEYVESIGIHNIARYEHDLLEYGQHALQSVSGLRLIGTALNKASVMSFTLAGYETEEVGKVLNQYGIAVRTGHHCAQPILRRFGVERTVRPSLAFYNTTEEIDLLVSVLHQLRRAKPYKS